MYFIIIILLLSCIGFKKCYKSDNINVIFRKYRQRNIYFYVKFCIFLSFLKIRKWTQNTKKDENYLTELENPHALSEHPKAFEAIFYIAGNKSGYNFIFGTERRRKGLVHGVLYFEIPNKGIFCLPRIPNTILFGTENGEETTGFKAEGMESKVIQPMKKWSVNYNGGLRQGKKMYPTEISLKFTSSFGYFNFDTDLHPNAIARSIATEEWTSSYFKALKSAHQTHYEQMGVLQGTVKIDSEIHKVNLQSFRDHSYGNKRDWDLMHRYAYFVMFLENDAYISIGIICQPCTGSNLEIGYYCTSRGVYHAIEWCDFQLYQHGESGTPPTDHAFQFLANDEIFTVQIIVRKTAEHFLGENFKARMVERFIDCKVNDVSGFGISEFNYSNDNGLPENLEQNDSD